MGYSNSVRAVKRVLHILEQMAANRTHKLEWEFEDTGTAEYAIRDGMKAANALVEYQHLRGLSSKYILRVRGSHIIAELRDAPLAVQMSMMVFSGVVQPLEVIGAAMEHKAPKMHFPNFTSFHESELETVGNWANANGYEVLKSPNNGIILNKTV